MRLRRLNIIIVEDEDVAFNHLKQDLEDYCDFVKRIYRLTYHNDVYDLRGWRKTDLLIVDNPENAGLDFLKDLYLSEKPYVNRIHSLIHTRAPLIEEEPRLYRESRFLHERSQKLFTGIIYKRFNSVEKIIEIIKNIVYDKEIYPIIDWMQDEEINTSIEPEKLILFREFHNLKHDIISELRPLVSIMNELSLNHNKTCLKRILRKYKFFLRDIHDHKTILLNNIKKFVSFNYEHQIFQEALKDSYELAHHRNYLSGWLSEEHISNMVMKSFSEVDIYLENKHTIDRIMRMSGNYNFNLILSEYRNLIESLNKVTSVLDIELVK